MPGLAGGKPLAGLCQCLLGYSFPWCTRANSWKREAPSNRVHRFVACAFLDGYERWGEARDLALVRVGMRFRPERLPPDHTR